MKIFNTTKGDLAVANGHVIPAMGSVDIPEKVLESASKSKVVQSWMEQGFLKPEGEIKAVDDAATKTAKKAAAKPKPPVKSKERETLEGQANELKVEFTDETSDEDLKKAVDDALNA